MQEDAPRDRHYLKSKVQSPRPKVQDRKFDGLRTCNWRWIQHLRLWTLDFGLWTWGRAMARKYQVPASREADSRDVILKYYRGGLWPVLLNISRSTRCRTTRGLLELT